VREAVIHHDRHAQLSTVIVACPRREVGAVKEFVVPGREAGVRPFGAERMR
jgi:hypothetical protein